MEEQAESILNQHERELKAGTKVPKVALVAGATGLVGRELVSSLLSTEPDWKLVYGVARRPSYQNNKCNNNHLFSSQKLHSLVTDGSTDNATRYCFLQCDLLDHDQTVEKLSPLAGQVTHLFWVTWASQFPIDTPECFVQNWTMLSNTLNALLNVPLHTLRHVSLQTGTKHYVSLEAPGLNGPYIEEDKNGQTELENDGNTNNFYHAMEILVTEQARRGIISWSVHRPGLLLGASERSFFNIVGTLCVYASLCQHINMPFYFYGTKFCWEEQYIDMSDARLVASQHIWWASLSPLLGKGEAFNTIDSTPFIWKEVWPELASKFGFEKTEETNWVSEERRYSEIMNDKEELWEEIIDKNGLRKTKIEELANWEFLDSLFRFPGKLMASSEKAKRFGFEPACDYTAIDSILYWVDCMREMLLIP